MGGRDEVDNVSGRSWIDVRELQENAGKYN